jgi:predicted  nucleic acid-binding Zn-ribbon protein
MTDSTVTLGDVQFDPVAIQDFRLSIEGTSGTGKSNTLAVLLEDLADVPLPALIIERLGALTPVRLEDDDILVVGARDEEGIDIPVALEDLDTIGEWVLDRGLKILVDISTYADYEDERSRVHLAAARALRSLNDRAHEKYRAGDRTKSLLVVDEAHILAPKDSAPEPELDEWVKRCRGQLIKASTEGGNKGVSIVVGYQRRAFLHNGVIQLAQDFIAHRPGDEDLTRTADALRCSEDELAGLETGEILARGTSITDGDLVGPTAVRKRRSPDPREEQFDLPEVSDDLADVLEEMQDEVEAERRRREQRQDELEQVRAENERLQERVDELEQELADTDRLASALENLGSNGGAAQDVGEGVADLQYRVDELKAERDELEATHEDLQEEKAALAEKNQRLEERVADLEAEVQEVRSAFESAAEHVTELATTFEVDVDLATDSAAAVEEAGDVEDLRAELATAQEQIQDLEAENERLREDLQSADGVTVPTDYQDFIGEDVVQQAIEEAKEKTTASPRYVKGVVAAIVQEGGPIDYDAVADRLGVSTTSDVSKAASTLEALGVLERVQERPAKVDFDLDGVAEIKEAQQRREQAEAVMEDL